MESLARIISNPSFGYVMYAIAGMKLFNDYKNNNNKSLVIFAMTTITMMNVRKNLPLAILVGLTVSNFVSRSGETIEKMSTQNICQNEENDERKMFCLINHIKKKIDPDQKYYRYINKQPRYGAGGKSTQDKITHFEDMINAFKGATSEKDKYCAGMAENRHKYSCLQDKKNIIKKLTSTAVSVAPATAVIVDDLGPGTATADTNSSRVSYEASQVRADTEPTLDGNLLTWEGKKYCGGGEKLEGEKCVPSICPPNDTKKHYSDIVI